MDVKKLGKFTEPGHALTGDLTRRSRRVGWEYVHSIVDDCSRLAYSEIHDDEKAPTVTAFTRRALDWFLDRGIVAERLLSDNAFTYIHNKTLCELLYRRAIRHLRTRPYTPRTNGKVERYQQTLQREWAYALQYASSDARRASLPHWIRHYNEQPHPQRPRQPPTHRTRSGDHRAQQLAPRARCALSRQALSATLEQLLTPRIEQGLRDLMLPADLRDRHLAAQPSKHDLKLLLDRPRAVLLLLAQRDSPSVEQPMLEGAPDSKPSVSNPSTPARGADQALAQLVAICVFGVCCLVFWFWGIR
jgi:hypothetical protein